MARQSLVLATIARLIVAQSTSVVTLPFYGVEGTQGIDASVITVDNSVTQYSLACPTTATDDDCGLFSIQILTYGPSTYNMYMSDDGFTGTQNCELATVTATADGQTATATAAACAESAAGSSANFPGSSTSVYSDTDIVQIPVTITAGLESAKAGTTAATTEASATSTVSGPSSAAAEAASSGASASSAATSTKTSTASSTASATSRSASATAISGAERIDSVGFAVFGGVVIAAIGMLSF